ncbi:MAG: YhcH/YjgK/YiaL family protein [Planctomycetia bacterium]
MILDDLSGAHWYESLHPGLKTAFDYLKSLTPAGPPLGRTDVDGDRVFALTAREPGRGRDAARLEHHERRLDVQYILDGVDVMGWKRRSQCVKIHMPYDAERDLAFFDDAPTTWFHVPKGSFTLFHPDDAHAPLAGDEVVHKIVVKVRIDW